MTKAGWTVTHGEERGYLWHKRRHEDACPECLEAHRDYNRRKQARLLYDALGAAMPGDWADRAECAKHDPRLWDDEKPSATKQAIAICGTCPVRTDCLQWAVETKQPWSTYGGLPAEKRDKLVRGKVA